VPLLRHDERLETGAPVRSLRIDELRRALRADGDVVPDVGSVLAALDGVGSPGAVLNLELKVPGAARALEPLRGRLDRVVFTSFHVSEVVDALARFPERPTGLLVSHLAPVVAPPGTALLSVPHRLVERARDAFPARELWTWTVNDEAAASRARRAGATVWIGDDVDAMRAWARETGP
jgi:glycerophosphoryl diester phosphodiesterase